MTIATQNIVESGPATTPEGATPPRPARLDAPEPGIYPDVPNGEYHAWEACNNSALSTLLKYSPMHVRWNHLNPPAPTPAMKMGSAVHMAVLEPDRFAAAYVVIPDFGPMQSSKNRAARDAWLQSLPAGTETISADDKSTCEAISQAVRSNQAVKALLDSPGRNELSLTWDHPVEGIRCKARADGDRPEWEAIIDVKTTQCASRSEFEKSIAEFGYHRQAAWYQDAFRAHGLERSNFAIIAVEKTPPYGVCVFRLMDEAIEAGREELAAAVKLYAHCMKSNVWPGYGAEFADISIPRWKMRQIIDRATQS